MTTARWSESEPREKVKDESEDLINEGERRMKSIRDLEE